MARPNYSLDDRLWQLAGAGGETFGDRAYATYDRPKPCKPYN